MCVVIVVGMDIGLIAVRTMHRCEEENISVRTAMETIIGMIVLIEETCVLIMYAIG